MVFCAKTQTGEDETLPAKGSHFAIVVYGVTFWYQVQEFHKMKRATISKREDRSWNVADLNSGTFEVGNNPFNFQMQAFWSNQCALS